MYPQADIPVVQLSLDRAQPPAFHYALGKELRGLRDRGVLIVGSGNIVHNLRAVVWQDTAFDWAIEFDERIKGLIESGDHAAIVDYPRLGPAARQAAPTAEHYLPLLYILALQDKGEGARFFAERVTYGSLSMRSVQIG
jgi:4,5-DOPA dioxygenase extradiol